jgi:hypothetical protein
MRLANLIVATLGIAAASLALTISWRGRRLPVIVRVEPEGWKAAAVAAIRTVAACLAAGVVAGFLAVGLFGRFVMRVLGATSGDAVQGRLTEAEERVGEITLGGTIGFVIFAGLLVPVALTMIYAGVRELMPDRAVVAGAVFGAVVLATAGVDDPLSPDNIDFDILAPTWLAVVLVASAALLFGVTAAVLSHRFERMLQTATGARWQRGLLYVPMLILAAPPILFGFVVYVTVRMASRGRIRSWLDTRRTTLVLRVATTSVLALSLWTVGGTVNDIL